MSKHQIICTSPDETKILEEAQERESKILLLEKFYTDTLPFFRQSLYNEVQKIVQTEIDEYKKNKEIKYIEDAKKQHFHITKTEDITYLIAFQLKQKYNLPYRKLARQQAVFYIKERYNLNQDLEKRFSYALLKQNSR